MTDPFDVILDASLDELAIVGRMIRLRDIARRVLARRDARYRALVALNDEIRATDRRFALADPEEMPDGKVLWWTFMAGPPGEAMSRSTVQHSYSPEVVNRELGERCHAAWLAWHRCGQRLTRIRDALQDAIDAFLGGDLQ